MNFIKNSLNRLFGRQAEQSSAGNTDVEVPEE
jgi:hypothetical protein